MNRALFILIFLVLGFLSYSQDILYLSNGDKLSAKITEINPTDVKYKDFTKSISFFKKVHGKFF